MFRRAALALLLALLAAGCAQEGKLIDVPVAVRGVAYDELSIADTSTVAIFFSIRFKVQVHATNPCERRHVLLELSRTGSTSNPVYIIRPVARYNTDDACMSEAPGASDTTITLTINSISVSNAASLPIVVDNSEGPNFPFAVDSTFHVPVPSTMRFRVKVESLTDASAIAGASVQLDSLSIVGGGVGPIGAPVVTDALGLATIDVPSTVPVGTNAFRYQVTVTNGADVRVMQVRDAPARGQSIERVFVRI